MLIPYTLLQIVIVPIISAPIIALIGRKIGKNVGWIAAAVLAYTTILLLNVGIELWDGNASIIEKYKWSTEIFNLQFGFLADNLSFPVALAMNLVCITLVIYSIEYIDHKIHTIYGDESKSLNAFYYLMFLFFATGFSGISFSTNLIEVYLFLDLLLIPLYFLIDRFGYRYRHRVAIMCFIWGFIGGILFLIGSVLAYSQTGSFLISDLRNLIGKPLALWAVTFLLLGMLVKLAVFGFHVWLPWVHAETPTCIAGILASIVGIENYLMARILYQNLYGVFKVFSTPLMIWALITMVYGALLTLAQDDIKRLCACSTISQTAYSILGLSSCTPYGVSGGIFYFISHSLGKTVIFSAAGIIVYRTGIRSMKEMGGLAKKMPITAALWILGSMILSAFPPLSSFQAEWIMFTGIFQQGIPKLSNLIIAVIGIFATFLTVVYTFWPAMRIFFGQTPKHLDNATDAPYSMTIPLLILALISFILGVHPELMMHFLSSIT